MDEENKMLKKLQQLIAKEQQEAEEKINAFKSEVLTKADLARYYSFEKVDGLKTSINSMVTSLNVLENDMDILEAVTAPRIHSQWLPDVIMIEENSISNAIKLNLENRGHTVEMYPYKKIGSANGILIDESGFWGGADPRRENSAIGY